MPHVAEPTGRVITPEDEPPIFAELTRRVAAGLALQTSVTVPLRIPAQRVSEETE